MRIALLAVVLTVATAPAMAQRSAKDVLAGFGIKTVEPLSAKEQATSRKKVDAELAKGGFTELFDDVSDQNGGKARHRASGLICPLGGRGQHVLTASGDGAMCETRGGDTLYRTRVVKAAADATLDSVVAAAQVAARSEPGYGHSRAGALVSAHPGPGSGRPDHRTFEYVSRVEGHERANHVLIGIVRGWVLTVQRMTDPTVPQPMGMGVLLSEASFGSEMGN